jgi:hypothetical protein
VLSAQRSQVPKAVPAVSVPTQVRERSTETLAVEPEDESCTGGSFDTPLREGVEIHAWRIDRNEILYDNDHRLTKIAYPRDRRVMSPKVGE